MGLEEYIRVFRCDGAIAYAVIGLLFFSVAGEITSRLRGWDSYFSRFMFLVFGTAGFLLGGVLYLVIRDSCLAVRVF